VRSIRRAALVLIVASAPFVLTETIRDPVHVAPPSVAPPGFLGLVTGPDGAEVLGVLPGSPAEAAGLRRGDRILELDGLALDNPDHLRQVTRGRRAGERVVVRVSRGAEVLDVTVVLQRAATTGHTGPARR